MSPHALASSTATRAEAGRGEVPALRADAARNVAQLRTAALAAFRGRGLTTPLEEIAAAAGVSKATIYNRFGGRNGLIDAVIGELVASEMYAIMERAGRVEDPWERIATYITDRRDLQYREPAFTDALRMTYPDSEQLVALAQAATEVTNSVLQQGHDAGVLRRDFTPGDLYYADVANGLALLAEAKPSREDYDRRTRLFLDSLHAR
ncbi:MAG: TetR family transcriptional regulator [Candidatus Nephthysia bennettiae]|uniref:TetR/AcrR family transcriptional regulator n=1 Tax=Candidatus Nephthysia bennettiae TaxID=3127016 RepID=A0A934K8Q3_9BACT|nr:TetR/AcrR family transcriptional regulator [Candidatus Dormibacteraeota bacterium]MBJ7613665.1 TetR/AcrR family transcriptional regulator [Candidatus Dormibacteraeota bacterium]PZR97040.1 MAG: TetR family transcriptional regulator [Candidatus Dormibacteraeota bacterium]